MKLNKKEVTTQLILKYTNQWGIQHSDNYYSIDFINFFEKKIELYYIFQDVRLGLTRSDYMIDGATDQLLQVELNTISTSSNGLACGVCELHRLDKLKHRWTPNVFDSSY